MIRPVGREPAVVYWLRRAVVISVALVMVAGAYYVYAHRHPAKHRVIAAKATPTPTPRPTGPAPTPTCPDSWMSLTAATDSSSYSAGSSVQLRLTITNAGKAACVRDVGAGANTFTITSGGYPTWSTADCNKPTGKLLRTLRPKAAYSVTMTWDRQRSLHGCPALNGLAKPGYYDFVGGNGGALSNKVTFSIN